MKTLFPAAVLLFVAVFLVPIASAQLPGPRSNTSRRPVPEPAPGQPAAVAPAQPSVFWCAFTVRNGTSYVNDTLTHADAVSRMAVIQAWFEYIRATYGIPFERADRGASGCFVLTAEADPQKYMTQTEQGWKASGHDLIHVNWTYAPVSTPTAASPIPPPPVATAPAAAAPAPAAPPAPVRAAAPPAPPLAPAAPSAAVGKAYRCTLNFHQATGNFEYSAGPIVSDAAQPTLTAAWNSYIDATYHPSDPRRRGTCTILSGNPANRERAVSTHEQNSNRLGVQTTHVNWTSAPSQ